jgi:HK97 family phage major capsid protein
MTLAELRKRFAEIRTEIEQKLDSAENGVITEELQGEIDALKAERAGILANIETRTALDNEERTLPADIAGPADALPPKTDGEVRVGGDREAERPFANLGDQLRAVATSTGPGATIDKRLYRVHEEFRAATGQSEAIAADGGFLVDQPLANGLIKRMFDGGEILSRVNRIPIGANANGVRFNRLKEDSRADGSRFGGVRGYWLAEAGALTASQMKFEQMELRLHKVGAVVYATEELLQDSTALEGEVNASVPAELRFQVENAIVNGDGSGKPLGFKSVAAYLSVAKETGQAADTVVAANAAKMWGRMLPGSFANAVWLVDQTVLPQLPLMTLGDQPVWLPNFQESPNGTLLGRPVITSEHLSPVGDAGDIILADLSQYRFIDKGGITPAVSMHVRFLYDERTFRFTYRVDGQPEYRLPLTPKSGGDTQSPFITVAARA